MDKQLEQRLQQLQCDISFKTDEDDTKDKILDFVKNTKMNNQEYTAFRQLIFDLLEQNEALQEELDDAEESDYGEL